MTVTASAIAADARFITLDTAGVRWTDAEILTWINLGQVEIVINKATASVVNGPIPLVAGVHQALPAGGLDLLDITSNTASLAACTLVKRSDLERALPTWAAATATVDAEHYMVDEDDPKSFLSYPPNTGAGSLTGRYSVLPATVALIGNTIALSDEYAPILLDYVMSKIWTKHTNVPNNTQRAASHYNNFLRALGVKIQSQFTYSPRRNAEDDNHGTSPVR